MRHLSSLLLTASLALPFAAPAFAEGAGQITVTGSATLDVAPDIATISLGVTTNGDTAAAAMAANNAVLAGVLARLRAAGIAERDLQTSNLSLNPNWVGYDSGSVPTIANYTASNILTVRVRALDSLGAVLDAAITDGANTLNGLTFGLAEPRPTEDAARAAAVADAIARARLFAEAAGTGLGPIVSISESGAMVEPMPMFRTDSFAGAVPVAGGEVGISAAVTMVFEIAQ